MTVACPACGSENEAGRKFCAECGSALAHACLACGSQNPPSAKFCGECGEGLGATASEPISGPAVAERRRVSVLFVDLVGFTSASEARDAEETRELLTRYFDLARTTIQRYGGTVEKFIGDAVMAVWGAPIAQEDDAERAVRAALELLAAVPTLDPSLKARAGVLSGEAAVTLGAEGQGMVAGDLVNTASRIQSSAEPGSVLVGEPTKRASEAAVAYDDAGEHTLKGKAEPVQLWRALRVVAGARGSLRSTGLEAPFVGRDRELRARQGALPRLRRRGPRAARADQRDRRNRQVSAGVGVREVHRRTRPRDILASRPLPLVRRRGRLLGARGDGEDALRHRRGRGARDRARQASALAVGVHPGRRGARVGRAASGAPAGARGGRGRRPGEPLLRLADPLRATGGGVADRARLRGRAMGGRGPARFPGVPARLVPQPPDLRACAGAARVRRQAPGLGSGQAQLQLDLPRAALVGRDGRPPHRPRAGPARRAARAHPRACGRRAPLRGRDGADAARPRAAHPRRATSTARRARSRRWRCRRPCTRWSLPASTLSPPRSGGWSRTVPCSARPSQSRAWPP